MLSFVTFYEFNYLPSKKELSIVSYNIHSGLDKHMFPTLYDTMNFLKNLDADIICLQEVNESSKAGFQVSSFKEELNMYSYFGANVLKSGNNYGLSIHSKYPIKYENHIYLTSKKEQRGMLHTTISIKGKKIDIINLHLGLSYEEQTVQIDEMLEYLKRLDNPYIVVGDFNAYNLDIDEGILLDAAKETGNSNTLTLQAGLERIDYIFVSPKIDIIDYEVLIESMSDHYPIKAKIKF
ncbi:MAG: endonuclease/exonuclease/phosphatase family protein [Peptostreptococcaceae bacterium]